MRDHLAKGSIWKAVSQEATNEGFKSKIAAVRFENAISSQWRKKYLHRVEIQEMIFWRKKRN